MINKLLKLELGSTLLRTRKTKHNLVGKQKLIQF